MGFKKVVKEITRLNGIDSVGHAEKMCKLAEEFGELAQVVNKTIGRKRLKPEDTKEAILANILEEGSDTIQCVISLLVDYGFTADQITESMKVKNKYWEKVIKERIKEKKNGRKKSKNGNSYET